MNPSQWASLYFAWPAGQVWPNIIASPIVGCSVWLWQRRHIKALHRKIDAQHAELVADNKRLHHHLGVPKAPDADEA